MRAWLGVYQKPLAPTCKSVEMGFAKWKLSTTLAQFSPNMKVIHSAVTVMSTNHCCHSITTGGFSVDSVSVWASHHYDPSLVWHHGTCDTMTELKYDSRTLRLCWHNNFPFFETFHTWNMDLCQHLQCWFWTMLLTFSYSQGSRRKGSTKTLYLQHHWCILYIFPALCGPLIVRIPMQNWAQDWNGTELGSGRLSALLAFFAMHLTPLQCIRFISL